MATQFNTEDKTELRNAALSITELTNWSTGGGLKSDVGNAVLNSGWPLTSGAQRTPNWSNMQAMYAKLVSIENKLDNMGNLPAADIAYIKSAVDELTADPATSGHDHPIVAAVEWADAN